MNIDEVINGARKAAEDLCSDPFMKIKAIDIEIAFFKMQIAVIYQKINELRDQRQQIWDSIKSDGQLDNISGSPDPADPV